MIEAVQVEGLRIHHLGGLSSQFDWYQIFMYYIIEQIGIVPPVNTFITLPLKKKNLLLHIFTFDVFQTSSTEFLSKCYQ